MSVATTTSRFVTAQDGLKLHVREHGDAGGASHERLPVVCLPGLTRTAEDFDALAGALAGNAERPHRVYALDYRGRGLSEHDHDPMNYKPATEIADVIAVLTALEIERAVFIGTSRGGIITMLLAAARPASIAAVVLNDIGPVIESKGLMRIKSYVGRLPRPRSFEEGADILRRLNDAQFPDQHPSVWLAAAKRAWREEKGRLKPTYDERLRRTLAPLSPEQPLPTMWAQFDAMGAMPLMVIRGANSDLLAPETVGAMRARRADLEVVEVAGQGHAPFLAEAEVIGKIAEFVAKADTGGR